MDSKNPESISDAAKKDIGSLNNEEFYNRCRTPSYAVKIIEDAIENHPVTESYLLQHNLISMKSNEFSKPLSSRSSRPVSNATWSKTSSNSNQPIPNKMHIYLVPTEVVNETNSPDNCRLGRPTRTTLLKERMNWIGSMAPTARPMSGSQRGCLSSQLNHNTKAQTDKSLASSENGLQKTDYAFMIGARYNRSRFIDPKVFPIFKQRLTDDHQVKSEMIPPQYYPSPPNTPHSSEIMEPPQPIITGVFSDTESTPGFTESQKSFKKKKQSPICSGIHPKLCPTMHSQFSFVSIKPSVLPIVVGQRCFESSNTNSPTTNSRSKTNWTRGSINLHFARQSRNQRTRNYDDLKRNLRCISTPIVNQRDLFNLEKQRSNGNCVKCISFNKEN